MATVTCPAGHQSTTTDYCDTCGAPIGAATGPGPIPGPIPGPGGGAGPGASPGAAGPAPGAGAGSGAEANGVAPGARGAGPGAAPGTNPGAEAGAGAGAGGSAPSPVVESEPAGTACPGCGEPVFGRFCESCGYDVQSGTPAAPPPVTLVLGTDRAHWERMVGSGEPAFPMVGPTLDLELTGDRAVLGRIRSGAQPDIELALSGTAADPGVSHHQCVFERESDRWTVRDAGSSNGTWINDADEPLAEGATHTLAHGDRILIGAWTCLTVRMDRAGRPPGSPDPAPSDPGGPSAGTGPS